MSHARILFTVLVLLTACGGAADESAAPQQSAPTVVPDDSRPTNDDHMDGHDGTAHGEFPFGRPADAADAGRTIEIRTGNHLAFEPAEVTVTPGETVTFSISNEGDLPHDFAIGDEAAQQQHAAEMTDTDGHGGQHDDANAVSVAPGETVELTWVFDSETEGLLYGCHEPGHYEAGMVGDIIIED